MPAEGAIHSQRFPSPPVYRDAAHMTGMDNEAKRDQTPFELPTQAGAGVLATWKAGKWAGQETEMRLFSDGYWRNLHSAAANAPELVMRHFTGHRLIDDEATP